MKERFWILLSLLFIHIYMVIVTCENSQDGGDEERCDSLTVLNSSRPPLENSVVLADIDKAEQSPTQTSNSTSFVLNYATCTLSGDRNALKGAVDAISRILAGMQGVNTAEAVERIKSLTSYSMEKQECPKWIGFFKGEKRKIFPTEEIKKKVLEKESGLLEYLTNPDFQYNLCRTINITAFPLCIEEPGCGYLKASGIDYSPDRIVGLAENTCKYILHAVSHLQEDTQFRNEFELGELRKDCESGDFFESFRCLSVNVTLRNKLAMYKHWYLKNKDDKLAPYVEKLRILLKGQASSLQSELSRRFRFKIPKTGDDCSGSIDFREMWSRLLNFSGSAPDGTLPFDFLSKIPIDEREVVGLVNKTCDVSQDLVCGRGCVCVCPNSEADKWRTCNGRAGKITTWNAFVMLCAVLALFCIK